MITLEDRRAKKKVEATEVLYLARTAERQRAPKLIIKALYKRAVACYAAAGAYDQADFWSVRCR